MPETSAHQEDPSKDGPLCEPVFLELDNGEKVDISPLDDESRAKIRGHVAQLAAEIITRDSTNLKLEVQLLTLQQAAKEATFDPAKRVGPFLSRIGFVIGYITRIIRGETKATTAIDELTGLKRMPLLMKDLAEDLAGAKVVAAKGERRRDEQKSVLFMKDLDGFKLVNDTLGHSFGNEVLKLLGNGWVVRPGDDVYRPGGDEFAVIARNGVNEAEDQFAFGERLRSQLATTVQRIISMSHHPAGLAKLRESCPPSFQKLDDEQVRAKIAEGLSSLDVSIGIAEITAAFTDPLDPIRYADEALYVAKRSGGHIMRYDPDSGRYINFN